MKKIENIAELKKIELDILLHFAAFCEKHGLRYFLAYGTLIGAVRHQGFIPWDDDIDLQMPREDYNKLIEMYPQENENARYELVSPDQARARHSIVKIIDNKTLKYENYMKKGDQPLGVDIDIFPVDGMPANDADFRAWFQELHKLYIQFLYACRAPMKGGSFKVNAYIALKKLITPKKKKILRKAKALHDKYPYETCEFVGSIETWVEGEENKLRKEWFDESVELPFEGHAFKAPKAYHEILTALYGDYMQLPPEEQRAPHHLNQTYWK